jgi:2'-5' RNA ligase
MILQLADTQRAVAEMARLNDVRVRLTRSDHFHVTLAFLGEVPSARVQSIINATRDGCTGSVRKSKVQVTDVSS